MPHVASAIQWWSDSGACVRVEGGGKVASGNFTSKSFIHQNRNKNQVANNGKSNGKSNLNFSFEFEIFLIFLHQEFINRLRGFVAAPHYEAVGSMITDC